MFILFRLTHAQTKCPCATYSNRISFLRQIVRTYFLAEHCCLLKQKEIIDDLKAHIRQKTEHCLKLSALTEVPLITDVMRCELIILHLASNMTVLPTVYTQPLKTRTYLHFDIMMKIHLKLAHL